MNEILEENNVIWNASDNSFYVDHVRLSEEAAKRYFLFEWGRDFQDVLNGIRKTKRFRLQYRGE